METFNATTSIRTQNSGANGSVLYLPQQSKTFQLESKRLSLTTASSQQSQVNTRICSRLPPSDTSLM